MEFRPYYMAKKWNEMGHPTTIIGASYSHLRQKQPQKLGWDKEGGVRYFWLWSNKYAGNGLARLFTMLVFIIQLIVTSLYFVLKIKPNVVIASSTYPLDIFPAWLIARVSGAQLLFEIHDLWPHVPQELGKMSKYHPFILLMALGEWAAFKLSDKVVSILPKAYEHVQKFGVKQKNYLHVPNGINLADYKTATKLPQEVQKTIAAARRKKGKLIGYAGAIGVANAIDVLLDAANSLKSKNIHFVIAGDGQEFENIKKQVHALKLSHVHLVGRINKLAVNAFLRQMDLLYIGAQHQEMYQYGVGHNKAFDYMMAEKPVIQSMKVSGDVIKRAGAAFNATPGSAQALTELIEKAVATPDAVLKEMGQKGKAFVLKYHEYSIISKQFIKFIAP